MALSVVNAGRTLARRQSIDWLAVQRAQFQHDENFHREISRLTVQDRMKHMALHFAKYAGRLIDAPDETDFKRTAVDTLVIAVSSSNVLNISLSDLDFPELVLNGRDDFVQRLVVGAGRMAAACEKMDHLEDFPFRRVLVEETVKLVQLTYTLFVTEGWEPTAEMHARLLSIKKKSMFHEQV